MANSVCVSVLQIMQLTKKAESLLLLLIPQKKGQKQNILLFPLTPAAQTVALPAHVWMSILWMLQPTSILLFFTTIA